MSRYVLRTVDVDAGAMDSYRRPQDAESFAERVAACLTAPRYLDGFECFCIVVWPLPDGVSDPTNMPRRSQGLTDYIQCGGSTRAMSVEIRVSGEDGSYQHWVVAREPVADPDRWVHIEWERGEDSFTIHVHPEEVFTGEQAAPVFRDYIVGGTLPPAELLRPLDI